MKRRMLMIVGDTPIRAACEAGLFDPIAEDTWVVLVSSRRATLDEMRGVAAANPGRVFLVELERPEVLDEAWEDLDAMPAGAVSFRFEDPKLYICTDSGVEGAGSGREAAFRAICSRALRDTLDDVLRSALGGRGSEQIVLDVLAVLGTFRKTGSAAGPVALGTLLLTARSFGGQADVRINVLLATRSFNADRAARDGATIGRVTSAAQLVLAEEGHAPTGPGHPRLMLGQVFEVGAARKRGMIASEAEARRAFALALQCLTRGGIHEALADLMPHMSIHLTETKPGNSRGERGRFAGVGAVEIVLEPTAAREFLREGWAAALPKVPIGGD